MVMVVLVSLGRIQKTTIPFDPSQYSDRQYPRQRDLTKPTIQNKDSEVDLWEAARSSFHAWSTTSKTTTSLPTVQILLSLTHL
eukprot:scaffold591_cov174-Ochromonas_danica.AAC.10